MWGRNRPGAGLRPRDMRTTRLLVALPAGLALIATAALAGCTSGGASSPAASGAVGAPVEASPAHAPAAKGIASSAADASSGNGGNGQAASAARLSPAGQQLIYTAQLTVRASDVSAAVSRATAIAADSGGYIASENASSNPDHPDQSTATIEVKIPVTAYAVTLGELSGNALGTRLSLQQQAQDVTQQVADVNSRVASDEAAISQLRALLSHAGSVGDLLDVQNQINSQESDLEALQAQQSALNHETAFATVAITILGPKAAPKPKKQKPPGLGNGLGAGWHAFRVTLSWLLAVVGAVLPFLVVLAALGAAGYWGRRWLRARDAGRSRPASGS
jgi:uncharacterized protein DUF4349